MPKVESFLLLLLLCLIPSQLSTHFWLPGLNFPRLDYLSFSIYLTDLIALLILFLRLVSGRLQLFKKPSAWPYLVGTAALFILVNIIFSLFPLLSAYKWLQLVLYLLLFSAYNWSSPVVLRVLVIAFSLNLIWISSLAIIQLLLSHSVGGLLYWLGERPLTLNSGSIARVDLWYFGPTLRAYSTFPHPNALAGFTLVSLAVVFILNRTSSFLSPRFISLLTLISLLGLFSAFSFSAFFVAGLCLLFFTYHRRLSALHIVGVSLALLSLTVILVFLIRPVSVLDRLDQLPGALTTLARHPLTGTGLGAFVLGTSQTVSRFGSFYPPVHNVFLLFVAEIGLGGVIIGWWLVRKFFTLKTNAFPSPFIIPLFLIMALGLFDHYWFTSHSNLILLLLLLVINFQKHVRLKSS